MEDKNDKTGIEFNDYVIKKDKNTLEEHSKKTKEGIKELFVTKRGKITKLTYLCIILLSIITLLYSKVIFTVLGRILFILFRFIVGPAIFVPVIIVIGVIFLFYVDKKINK